MAGIAVAPIEKKSFVDPIVAAMDKDIPVITFDADLENEADRTAYVGTDNVSAKRIRQAGCGRNESKRHNKRVHCGRLWTSRNRP